MRARKNESTAAILEALAAGEASAKKIAATLNTNIPKVSMILLNLTRHGYVSRRSVQEGVIVVDQEEKIERPRYVFLYSITERGVARLDRIQNPPSKKPPKKGHR